MLTFKHSIIGALHLAPLAGYSESPGYDHTLELALADLEAFQSGGVDAVIFENNYDLPHHEHISAENYELMLKVGRELKRQARMPLGVNVLWNDYESALKLAKELGLDFIRVPVFVDDVRTSYGTFHGVGAKVAQLRAELGATGTQILADIHVKHATILSTDPIKVSAQKAIEVGADGLIITGKWTGDSPDLGDLKTVRQAVGDFPIIVGSGADSVNIKSLFGIADAAIVSTSLKEGVIDTSHTNLADWEQRIDARRVSDFMRAARSIS